MPKLISIIIPALNMEKYIELCLRSLRNLDYSKYSYEIIVIDNGSIDQTIEIARKYSVQILLKKEGNISSLRNFGAQNAKGEILAFIDSDCTAPTHWLKEAVDLLSKDKIGAVGGWYTLSDNPSLIERAWDAHLSLKMKYGITDWLPSSDFIITKKVFESIGGFNEALITGEDFDICQKIKKQGLSLYSSPDLTVVHLRNPKTLHDFFLKELWRGKGGLQMFVANFPKLHFTSTIIFALLILGLLLCIVIGLGVWLIGKTSIFFLVSLFCLAITVGIMGIKVSLRESNISLILPLGILYFLFGLSRALALCNIRTWMKVLSIKRKR